MITWLNWQFQTGADLDGKQFTELIKSYVGEALVKCLKILVLHELNYQDAKCEKNLSINFEK